jgi:hypothetical protein
VNRLTLAVLISVGSLLMPVVAQATPVTISVESWNSGNGGFGFSALHAATSAAVTKTNGGKYWRSGAINYQVNPDGLLTGDLSSDVLTMNGSMSLINAPGQLLLNGTIDFGSSVTAGALMGTLDYELTTSGGTRVETGTFYFFNYNDFANDPACNPNDLCAGDIYRLWGNNWNNVDAGTTQPADNVMVSTDSGTTFALATAHRGIDMGGVVAAVPEPGPMVLFSTSLIVASILARRSRRS